MKDSKKQIPTDFIDPLKRDDFTSFLRSLTLDMSHEHRYVSITLPVARIDPLAVLEMQEPGGETFYWEHPQEGTSLAAFGSAHSIRATGVNRFQEIAEQAEQIQKKTLSYTAVDDRLAGPLFLGGYSFYDYNVGTPWNRFGAARFFLPNWVLIRQKNRHLITLVIPKQGRRPDEIFDEVLERLTYFIMFAGQQRTGSQNSKLQHSEQQANHSDQRRGSSLAEQDTASRQEILCDIGLMGEQERWKRNVETCRDLIRNGEFEKIVIARKLTVSARRPIRPTRLSYVLRERYPDCTTFFYQPETKEGAEPISFVGSTPETLVRFRNDTLSTEGLAGSISRGGSALEDHTLEQKLLHSQKDLNEHQYVVQSIRESLKKLTVNVTAPKKPGIKKLKHVQHLHTPIQATLNGKTSIHNAVAELHPTPAVGGFPRDKAVRHIEGIEQVDRGWYASPIGWFHGSGEGNFVVAIRSALLETKRATLYAGCGIVEDSDPETEWQETMMKFSTLLDALVMQSEP